MPVIVGTIAWRNARGDRMAYRRSRERRDEACRWTEFVQANERLLVETGVPASIYRFHEMWTDLLMHGHIDHHEDATHFHVSELSAEQRRSLKAAVDLYLEAGFGNPGLVLYPYDWVRYGFVP
jgi:hypothetical protein